MTSPIARVIAELETERENLTARLGKVDAAIATMRDLFHLSPAPRETAKPGRKAKVRDPERGSSKGDQAKDAIRAALKGGPMTSTDLAAKLRIKKAKLQYYTRQLQADGIVVLIGAGRASKVSLAGTRSSQEEP